MNHTSPGRPPRGLCVLGGWLLAVGIAGAQTPPSGFTGGAGGLPPSLVRPEGVKIDGMTPEIEAFLRKLGAVYFAAKSYRDAGRSVLVQHQGLVKTTTEAPTELSFRRPNRLRLETGQYSATCDGKSLVFAVPSAGQVTPQPAPDTLTRRHLAAGSFFGSVEEGHPEILDFLTTSDAITTLLARVTRITSRTEANRRTLVYETTGRTRITLEVDPQRMVLLAAVGETLPPEPGAKDPSVPDAVTLRCDFGAIVLDADIPDTHFKVPELPAAAAANPASTPGAKPGSASPETDHLVDKPLPALTTLPDLTGAAFDPAQLKDKAALLFFWSADGGEHSLKAITVVQHLADRFRDRTDLVILGIVTDPDPLPLATQLLERKGARFRCLTDAQAKWRQAFRLAGVPTFALADRAGIVRWALLGAPPSVQDDLGKQVDLILAAGTKK